MRVILTHGLDGVAWSIVDENGEIVAQSHAHHLTEMGAKDEAMTLLRIVKEGLPSDP